MANLFPKWFNVVPTALAVVGTGGLVATVGAFWYWATPKFFEVGYMPTQPGNGFNHQIHAGKLGLDCRYCHTKVETSPEANVPNVATCMGCHEKGNVDPIKSTASDVKVQFIRDAYTKNGSIPWRRIHKLPDYVRNFPHAAHIKAGVSCYSCHGQITAMPVVAQQFSLSMSWCLDCHRKVKAAVKPGEDAGPLAPYIVGPENVTKLQWVQEEWMADPAAHEADARRILESLQLQPPENCGACHY